MNVSVSAEQRDELPSLQAFLDRASALELARRSLVGAPVYAVISLIMVFGTPFLRDFGWWVFAEAGLLILLGAVRVLFAIGFAARYDRIGEKAVIQFSVLTAIQSLTLGVLAGIVIWQYWATQEAVLTIVLSAGCIAAGTSALSVRHSAQLIFLACVLGPFGIAVLLVGGLPKALLIVGFLVLMAFLVQDGGQARSIYLQRLREHYEDQLNQRRVAVENEAKRKFLADIGHTLRAPANSIIGLTALLEEEPLDRRTRGFIKLIRQNCDSLLKLVDDIPGSVRTQKELAGAHLDRLDLQALVSEAVQLYRSKADEKGVDVRLHFDAPRTVLFGDASHLKQVLANLMSNAVQFTEEGAIDIRAEATAPGADTVRLEFSVEDTGPGIAPDVLPTVFNPFGAQGAKTSGRYGGGGLGLPTCKGLVELMGGDIDIESVPGQGTEVRFWIQARRDPADDSGKFEDETAESRRALADEHPHRILVVDDDEVHRHILCTLLRKRGYEPDEAANGEEAVAAALEGDYDRIFMDLRMPGMGGLEATGRIRERLGSENDLRIIALTGDALKDTRRAALRGGMDHFVPKPVQPAALEEILRRGSASEEWRD